MEAYSLDLRERICAACDEGLESRAEVAERFGVSRWFVHKILRQRRTEGSIAPKPRGHGPAPRIGTAQQQCLKRLAREKPDATLAELCARLQQAQGVHVSKPVMCRALQRLGLPLKKSRWSRRNARHPVSGRCGATGRNVLPRWIRPGWYLWTKAASTHR